MAAAAAAAVQAILLGHTTVSQPALPVVVVAV